jgi:hypothetical protein
LVIAHALTFIRNKVYAEISLHNKHIKNLKSLMFIKT